jgi:uncharacterized protein YifE (UPF0438 family)
MLEEIDRVLSYQKTLKTWRNNHTSTEWIESNSLNRKLFGDSFSKSHNCGCVEDFFILLRLKREKILKFGFMEKKFILKKGKTIMSFDLGLINEHSTDEQYIELIRRNPSQISKFEKFPENWEEIVFAEKKVTAKKTRKPRAKKVETNESDI